MYRTIRIPKALIDEIDQIIEHSSLSYRSRAEFVNEAIRTLLHKTNKIHPGE